VDMFVLYMYTDDELITRSYTLRKKRDDYSTRAC
jgi:hypothetical protein